jgi:MinD-like ATPase involved in chromosome partitioning or flagellar assembly
LLVVNRVSSYQEAEHVAERICGVARKFLDLEPRWIGSIPEDGRVTYSVNHRVPVVQIDEKCAAAQALRGLSVVLLDEIAKCRRPGVGRSLVRETFAAGTT